MGEILYCHCSNAGILPQAVRDNVLKYLCDSNLVFTAVSDLCGQCVCPNEIVKACIGLTDERLVIACYPRAVKALLKSIKSPSDTSLKIANLRTQNLKQILDLISECRNDEKIIEQNLVNYSSALKIRTKWANKFEVVKYLLEQGMTARIFSDNAEDYSVIYAEKENWTGWEIKHLHKAFSEALSVDSVNAVHALVDEIFTNTKSPKWYPWFPVVDSELCSQCLQCLSFCLFGVYDVDSDGKLAVVNPEKCKTNCPACARVCPDSAIIFPKHATEPINGGEVQKIPSVAGEQKVDIQSLIQGNLYDRLKERSRERKERFAPSKTGVNPQLAQKERQYFAEKFAADISPNILASLPSQEELRKLANEAQERTKRAMDIKNREQK
ncbi:MAG: hypothetical protein N2487_02035 [Verrucomicrobiae bacterium]|nr:hypothetical protein [Verrucomicrobiae bacterium]